jgi:hypothetical protein
MAFERDKHRSASQQAQEERLANVRRALTTKLEKERVKLSTFEDMMTHPMGFALTTASPVQRAIMRVVDGRPIGDLWGHPAVVRAFGGEEPTFQGKPKEIALLAGIRCGKSLITAGMGVWWTQTCSLDHLGPGEVARVSIVSISRDLAEVVFGHVVGRVMASPILRGLVMEDPKVDEIVLRHPSGRPVQINVAAGTRAGSSLVARWCAGCIFDEFPRMLGEGEAVVNWDELRRAVLMRMCPGSQVASIGSPYAPYGPAYNVVRQHFGKPSKNMVVIKAPGWDMNPALWTPKAVREAEEQDPQAFRTDVAAEFAQPEEALIASDAIESSTRENPLIEPPKPGMQYSAAIDPATRGNAWTLIVACQEGQKRRVVLCRQWIGTPAQPLRPAAVLEEIAAICKGYRIAVLDSDQYYGDALRDLAAQQGLILTVHSWNEREKLTKFLAMKTMFEQGMVELPPDGTLRTDISRVRKVIKGSGASISLPRTSDGRHCDYAPCLAMALGRYWQPDHEVEAGSSLVHRMSSQEADIYRRVIDRSKRDDGFGFSW